MSRYLVFLDSETSPPMATNVVVLIVVGVLVLLSDFRSPKASSFLDRSSRNFSHILIAIFCVKLP